MKREIRLWLTRRSVVQLPHNPFDHERPVYVTLEDLSGDVALVKLKGECARDAAGRAWGPSHFVVY